MCLGCLPCLPRALCRPGHHPRHEQMAQPPDPCGNLLLTTKCLGQGSPSLGGRHALLGALPCSCQQLHGRAQCRCLAQGGQSLHHTQPTSQPHIERQVPNRLLHRLGSGHPGMCSAESCLSTWVILCSGEGRLSGDRLGQCLPGRDHRGFIRTNLWGVALIPDPVPAQDAAQGTLLSALRCKFEVRQGVTLGESPMDHRSGLTEQRGAQHTTGEPSHMGDGWADVLPIHPRLRLVLRGVYLGSIPSIEVVLVRVRTHRWSSLLDPELSDIIRALRVRQQGSEPGVQDPLQLLQLGLQLGSARHSRWKILGPGVGVEGSQLPLQRCHLLVGLRDLLVDGFLTLSISLGLELQLSHGALVPQALQGLLALSPQPILSTQNSQLVRRRCCVLCQRDVGSLLGRSPGLGLLLLPLHVGGQGYVRGAGVRLEGVAPQACVLVSVDVAASSEVVVGVLRGDPAAIHRTLRPEQGIRSQTVGVGDCTIGRGGGGDRGTV